MMILVMDILSWFVFELHLTVAICILQVLVWTSLVQQHKMCQKMFCMITMIRAAPQNVLL